MIADAMTYAGFPVQRSFLVHLSQMFLIAGNTVLLNVRTGETKQEVPLEQRIKFYSAARIRTRPDRRCRVVGQAHDLQRDVVYIYTEIPDAREGELSKGVHPVTQQELIR